MTVGPRGRPAPGVQEARRGRVGGAFLALAVLAGACGGSGDKTAGRTPTGATTTTTAVTTAGSGAAAPVPGIESTSATVAGLSGASATTAGSAATTTTTTRSVAPLAPGFTPPGTYRYVTTGSFTSSLTGTQARNGEITLTVDPPSGTDQRSVRSGFGRMSEQVLRLRGGDALVVSLRLIDQGIDKEVRPSPPALALPGDAGQGSHWSWRAVSTDTKTTVDSSFRVLRTEDVTVGADRVPTLVVELVLTITGDVTSTSRQTLWISAAKRLVVRQDDTSQGTLGVLTFSATSSDTLISLAPS